MGKDKYKVDSGEDHLTYTFYSEGPKGKILKIILYQPVYEDLYNLAFGDANGEGFEFDDFIRTNNQDTDKVLATVASTLYDFFDHYNGALVIAQGSTHSRTRLYRRYLTAFLEAINSDFMLYGELEGELERFRTGLDYQSFLIRKVKS
jgi:hypothetical protein